MQSIFGNWQVSVGSPRPEAGGLNEVFIAVSFRSPSGLCRPPPAPILSEEQLWSTGLRGLNLTGGAAAIICHTGGGLENRQGKKRKTRAGGEKGGENAKWRFETDNLSHFVVEHSSIQ